MIPESGIYTGTLRHRRFQPRKHDFTYRLFMAWLDVDQIPSRMAKSRWTSYNRFNWASYYETDHFGDPRLPLRERLRKDAQAHGIDLPDGPIFLLTHLRYLGYCFNPISLYFFYERNDNLGTVLAEVNSTFGETSNYWLPVSNRVPPENSLRFRVPKVMHVSPFMGMDLDYEFVLTQPSDTLVIHMNTIVRDASPRPFDATLTLQHQPWAALPGALVRHPWMTAKVIGAIHWEAFRLYVKGIPVLTHPARLGPRGKEATRKL
jgi:uncharacterized protein